MARYVIKYDFEVVKELVRDEFWKAGVKLNGEGVYQIAKEVKDAITDENEQGFVEYQRNPLPYIKSIISEFENGLREKEAQYYWY